MSISYLPTDETFSILGGELMFKPDGSARPRSMGHIASLTFAPSIETIDAFAGTTGVRTKVASAVSEQGAILSITAQELTVQNIAYATLGEIKPLLQAAVTAGAFSETDVLPGEYVDFGAINVTNVMVDGGLVENVDYIVNAEAGHAQILTAQADFSGTFDAPEIVAGDNRQVVEILASGRGISGEFSVTGRNQVGKRYKFERIRATLRPTGDLTLLSDGSDFAQIELEGEVIFNSSNPAFPFGRIVPLN